MTTAAWYKSRQMHFPPRLLPSHPSARVVLPDTEDHSSSRCHLFRAGVSQGVTVVVLGGDEGAGVEGVVMVKTVVLWSDSER